MTIQYPSYSVTGGVNGSNSLAVPSGTVDGDLLLAVLTQGNGSVFVTISGSWTMLTQSTDGANHSTVVYKRTASSEPASYTATSTTGNCTMIMVRIKSSQAGTTVSTDMVGAVVAGNSNTPTATSITPTKDGSLLFIGTINNSNDNNWTKPASFDSEILESNITTRPSIHISNKITSGTFATGSISATTGSSTAWKAVLLQIYEIVNILPNPMFFGAGL